MAARRKRGAGRARRPAQTKGGGRRSGAKPAPRKAPRKAAKRRAAGEAPARRARGHRLSGDVRPLDVDLHVDVDPARGPEFHGSVRHRLAVRRARRSLELHVSDLRVARAVLEVGDQRLRGKLELHPERHTVEVRFPERVPAGEVFLTLQFRGRLRDDLRGLYAARSGERRYAFTQLEAADARRFFPCFDEPAMKARFQLSVTTARGHTVLSNNPVAKIEPLPGGRKTVHFQRTPKLSTYLLALAVGELEASEPVRSGDTEIRVWHVPGKQHLTAFALEAARECLTRLEGYFDLPYPYAKLDLVAAPDFEAGAMENAGAVFFRETLLLLDPETATLQEKKRVAEVVCHELAHMWYGDLVTMAWWDDLWLNEAFATWMAFHVVDAWKPDWKMWNDFQHYRAAALSLDALAETHPIYGPVRSPEEATENFDLITYEKGASVVRMIERYLGAETFRSGVRRYIREHQEGNTVAADLWEALSEASGQEVEPVVRAWIEQPGFPLLHVERLERAGRAALRLRQERFRPADAKRPGRSSAKPGARRAGAAEAERWPVPCVVRVGAAGGGTRTERHLLLRAREDVALDEGAPRFVYANADEGGFFRPLHTEAELQALAASREELSPVERMGLLGHQWAIVRAGHAAPDGFLDLAVAFADERDPDVLTTLRAPLAHLVAMAERVAGEEMAARLRRKVAECFAPSLAKSGFDARPGDDDTARLRRAALLALVGEVGEEPSALAAGVERCDRYLADRRSVEPNLVDLCVAFAARDGDARLFERFLAAASDAVTPQERRRFQMALGAFRKPALVDRALSLSLGDAIGTQDVAMLLTRMLGNPGAREATWAFMKRRWTALRRRMPPMLVTRPIDALPGLATREARRDVAAFFRAHPVPTAHRAVRQALEHFDLGLAFDARAAEPLRRWISTRAG